MRSENSDSGRAYTVGVHLYLHSGKDKILPTGNRSLVARGLRGSEGGSKEVEDTANAKDNGGFEG